MNSAHAVATATAGTPRQRALALVVLSTVLVAFVGLLWASRRAPAAPTPVVRELAVFDSYARLTLWTSPDRAEPALQECAQELAELHRRESLSGTR